ncbi:MAG: hypothetical protein PHS93_08265 [Candidatus Omnitrophica bacterium]|nr:hypothetical protein [Candidatus Omnitrophota bacterium]MDD5589126.1 hypothetical protein [Candidatus Nanoarchaeia archaeon]
MLYKSAVCKAEIQPITKDNVPFLKKFASRWVEFDEFPDRYKALFANYIKANSMRVGTYNPEFKYYRVIAMHGDIPNENGDLFLFGDISNPEQPELLRFDKNLNKQVYLTMAGRGNFINHQNDDVTKAVGLVLDVAPNHEGKFIEALLAVDTKKDPGLVRSIDMGITNSVSMGALCGYSICSICGNEAANVNEYCDHIKYHKARKIYHDGEYKLAYEDNRNVNLIELSWVTVPADPDAKLLEKIAKQSPEILNEILANEDSKLIYANIINILNDASIIWANDNDIYKKLLTAIRLESEKRSNSI